MTMTPHDPWGHDTEPRPRLNPLATLDLTPDAYRRWLENSVPNAIVGLSCHGVGCPIQKWLSALVEPHLLPDEKFVVTTEFLLVLGPWSADRPPDPWFTYETSGLGYREAVFSLRVPLWVEALIFAVDRLPPNDVVGGIRTTKVTATRALELLDITAPRYA